jgi:uncharacterized membrane protein YecN with MAPEG domain
MLVGVHIPWICIGLLGALLFYLGLAVSMVRKKIGKTKDTETKKKLQEHDLISAQRAHGNTAEYAPMLCILYFIFATQNMSNNVVICTLIVATTIARYLIAYGIRVSVDAPHFGRFWGASITYLGGFVLSVILVLHGLGVLPSFLH